jgi:hypothetical protein
MKKVMIQPFSNISAWLYTTIAKAANDTTVQEMSKKHRSLKTFGAKQPVKHDTRDDSEQAGRFNCRLIQLLHAFQAFRQEQRQRYYTQWTLLLSISHR